MPAVLVTLAVFCGWWAIGLALLAGLRANTRSVRVALAAPALGTAVTVIPLFFLSNLGIPMQDAGPPTIFVLLGGSLVVLALRRPRVPPAAVPVVLVCLASLVLVARPMFHFGFHWIANANGDMAYYVLSATSLLHHGLLDPVDVAGLAQNRSFATSSQTLHAFGVRVGADITLSAVAATTRRSPIDLYMPLILSFNLCAICAAGSLAMQFARKWWAATIAAALLAISPLATYGVLQQLLPQVWGLGLAVALFALLMRPELHRKPGPRVAEVVPVCVLAAALFAVYVELGVSLSAAYGLYVALLAIRRRVTINSLLRLWVPPVAATALVINTFLGRELHYLGVGVHGGVGGGVGIRIFGYSLVPTALPGIVGLKQLFASPTAAYAAPSIIAAVVLLAVALVASAMGAVKGSAASVILIGDFALGALLAYKASDFGLFKLYMYCQPFLAAAVAGWFSSLSRRPAIVGAAVLLTLLSVAQLRTQSGYVAASRSPIDLPHASEADLLPAFRSLLRTTRDAVVPVTDNFTLAGLEGASAENRRLYFVSRNVFDLPWKTRHFRTPLSNDHERVTFGDNTAAGKVLLGDRCSIAMPTGSQVVLNRRALPEGSRDLVAIRCAKAKNLLVFVVSSVGQPATVPEQRAAVSFWQLEHDSSFPGHTLSGFGRYALLRIIKPSPRLRLELDFSTSSLQNAAGSYQLPRASAIGATRVRFPVVGVGAARVFSPPLRPQIIGGQAYVLLDMGVAGQFPIVRRTGIAGLWGRSVSLDPRRLTSYVRNVSLVGQPEYNGLQRPSVLRSFPADLAKRDLEYSGIFEDGWVGKRSYAVLAGGRAAALRLRANALHTPAGQRLRVVVNGRTVYSRSVAPGPVAVNVPLPASVSPRRIELEWTQTVRLQAPDRRSAAALLTYLGAVAPP